jgi:hypothetical protein
VRELFVWYRVRDDRIAEALAGVRAMQDSLARAWPGLRSRLLTRADGSGVETWMEAYSVDAVAAPIGHVGIDADIERAIEAAALPLAALLDSVRHAEAFATIAAS